MKFTLKWCVWTPIALLICILIATVIILTIPPAGKTISEAETDTETVKTIYGTLRGQKIYTLYGERPYYSFRGIPYAKPPIGELRFKASALCFIKLLIQFICTANLYLFSIYFSVKTRRN